MTEFVAGHKLHAFANGIVRSNGDDFLGHEVLDEDVPGSDAFRHGSSDVVALGEDADQLRADRHRQRADPLGGHDFECRLDNSIRRDRKQLLVFALQQIANHAHRHGRPPIIEIRAQPLAVLRRRLPVDSRAPCAGVSNINMTCAGTRTSTWYPRPARRNCCWAWRHVGSGHYADIVLGDVREFAVRTARRAGRCRRARISRTSGRAGEPGVAFRARSEPHRLVHRRHEGPLQVQKALYPEGPGICHVALLHPPGGIAGCDRLNIRGAADQNSHTVLTTPGATKWYRSAGGTAEQRLQFALDGNSVLEWLPRENILFDGCKAAMSTEISLSAGARCLRWGLPF